MRDSNRSREKVTERNGWYLVIIPEIFIQAVGKYPKRPALIAAGRTWLYEELGRLVARASQRLQEVVPASATENRIAIVGENHPAYVVAYWAGQSVGCSTVEISRNESLQTLIGILNTTAPRFVLTDRVDLKSAMQGKIHVESFEEFLTGCGSIRTPGSSQNEPQSARQPIQSGQEASIVYTSGTTSSAKGVILSHKSFCFIAIAVADYLGLNETDRCALILPLSHTYGKSVLLSTTTAGAAVVVLSDFGNPKELLSQLTAEGCTVLSAVPYHLHTLVKSGCLPRCGFSRLRIITSSANKLATTAIDGLVEALPGVRIFSMYGLTEATTRACYLSPELIREKNGSCGRPLSGVELKVVTEDGRTAAAGEVGEVLLRGPNVMTGYWNDPDLTAKTVVDGWLKTGDQGHLDADGFLYIVGRKNEFIKCAGERVNPMEIEEVLREHPGVLEAAVVGMPDSLMGETIHAYVTPRDLSLKKTELFAHCRTRLSRNKVPYRYTIIASLPATNTGKVQKNMLVDGRQGMGAFQVKSGDFTVCSYERLIRKGSLFELQDAFVNGIPCKVFRRGPKTLRDVFMKATSFADRDFIVKGDVRMTFGQAFRFGSRLARMFRKKYNIRNGSRVAIIMKTGPEWAIVFIACCFAGAVPVLIPDSMEDRTVSKVLGTMNCELAVADMFSIFDPADAEVDKTDDKNDAHADAVGALPDDIAMISFTSGTTGTPKGVVISHRNMTTGLMNMMMGGFLPGFRAAKNNDRWKQPSGAQPCSLLLSPFSHIGGYSQLMLMCYLGGKIVLMSDWDTRHATALVKNEHIRSLCGLSSAMVWDLLRANRSTDNLSSLVGLNIHGVALRRKFIHEVVDGFPHISLATGYGMTETSGAVSAATGMDLLSNPEFNGQPFPGVDIKITDHDGRETSRVDHGEIWVRGAMVMQGYCFGGDNSSVILENGWLKTGDQGYVDETGSLYVIGRHGTIHCGKKRISTGGMERLICEIDAVDEAVVLETYGSRHGTGVMAVVVPSGVSGIDKNKLARKVAACVRDYINDIKVVVMDEIPRTTSGKADHAALKSLTREEIY